ncbi:MAG: HprK-related kinase A, partial [Thiobacillus sp.]
PRESVRRQHESAKPGWVIFPRWEAGAKMTLTPRTKEPAFLSLSHHALNYKQLGADGFRVGSALIEQTTCYDFQYSQLQEAIEAFDHLANTSQSD